MDPNSVEMDTTYPQYDIEEIKIKNEPIDVLSENEQEIEEA